MMMMMSAKMFSVQEINFLSPEKIALFSNGAHLSPFLKINQSDIFLSKVWEELNAVSFHCKLAKSLGKF